MSELSEQDPEFDLDELFSYVYHSSKYYDKLRVALKDELWEYSAILVWKVVILFIYEKLYQIHQVKNALPEFITNSFKEDNLTCYSCYAFRNVKDNNLVNNLKNIWQNVNTNHTNNLNSLLNDRNGLSHVNEYEENYNKIWFLAHFDKSIASLKHFQEVHKNQFAKDIYDYIKSGKYLRYLSEKDILQLLNDDSCENTIVLNHILDNSVEISYSDSLNKTIKDYIINSFLQSSSFASALQNGKRLLKIVDDLEDQDLVNILRGIFEEQGSNNQIIYSEGMDEVFNDLFEKTINIKGIQDEWKTFLEKLTQENNSDAYKELKEKFEEVYGEE